MATTYNKIIVVGHLSREPELRYTPTGTAVTTFAVATNHRYKSGDAVQEETCFLDVVVFGRQAETVSDYLHKGHQALVDGRLRHHTWETPDGQKRSKHEIVAERVQFLGTRAPGTQAPLTPGATDAEAADEEEASRSSALIATMIATRGTRTGPQAVVRSRRHPAAPRAPSGTPINRGGRTAAPAWGRRGGPRRPRADASADL